MVKFITKLAAAAAIGAAVITLNGAPLWADDADQRKTREEQLELFANIFDRVSEDYVEEVDEVELMRAAIDGMLTSLDPHSSYLSPDDSEKMQIQTQGSFGGLGIEVTQEDGYVKVVAPMDGTPAAQAGIEAGDLITQVDGEGLVGLSLDEAVELMRGPVGSEILITVLREGTPEPFEVSIIRDVIRITAVRGRLEGETVILRISKFNEQTDTMLVEEFEEQVAVAGGLDNIDGVILDLRNNPGGLLSQAIRVSDAFLDEGEIVSTRSRNSGENSRVFARAGDLADGKPIIVLINTGSASASEIVAGALQDHKRAVVLGTKSFGKGSVQTIMPLRGEGGAMRLTTARYYTPSGRSIQSLGILPDIIVEQPQRSTEVAEDEEDLPNRREADLRGRLSNDSLSDEELEQIRLNEEEKEAAAALRQEDYQVAYALDILRGLALLNAD